MHAAERDARVARGTLLPFRSVVAGIGVLLAGLVVSQQAFRRLRPQ